jgi:hypothetical protein
MQNITPEVDSKETLNDASNRITMKIIFTTSKTRRNHTNKQTNKQTFKLVLPATCVVQFSHYRTGVPAMLDIHVYPISIRFLFWPEQRLSFLKFP